MVEVVQMYKANDGTLFADEQAAVEHNMAADREMEFTKFRAELVEAGYDMKAVGAIASYARIFSNWRLGHPVPGPKKRAQKPE